MHIVVGRKPHISYPILLTLGEWFGIISVILAGLLFDKSVSINSGIYDWENSPFSYHPVMMTAGLLFCYGNAILLYRTFKQPPKLLVKIFHAIFLLISLAFGVVGFVAIVRQKDIGNRTHFMTYHSWIGLTTLILFVLQWVFGFIIYLFPTLSLDVRTNYMPT
jgi:cytochrome b-561